MSNDIKSAERIINNIKNPEILRGSFDNVFNTPAPKDVTTEPKPAKNLRGINAEEGKNNREKFKDEPYFKGLYNIDNEINKD
jgi:hypothetical protein